MSLSRRQFVYVASLSAVAAAANPSLFAQEEAQTAGEAITEEGSAIVANLSLKDFQWLVGERFSISSPGKKLGKLTLIEATVLDPVKPSHAAHLAGQAVAPARGPAVSGFSLRFQGAGGTLPQDTYIMSQSGIGTFPLFMVPEGPGGSSHPTYLAIFTRFAGPAPVSETTPSQ